MIGVMYTAADGFLLAGLLMMLPGFACTVAWPFARRWLLSGPVARPAGDAVSAAGSVSLGIGWLLLHFRWEGYTLLGLAAAELVIMTAVRVLEGTAARRG